MKRFLSMFLALCMVFTMLPVWVLADGGGSHREIVAFAELKETEKTIMPGTALEDLDLPETLTATVMVPRIADSGDTDSGGIDSGDIDSGDGYLEFIVPVPVTTWVSTPEYDIEAEVGTQYVFTPVIERYTVIAALPEIKMTVGAPMMKMGLLAAGAPIDISAMTVAQMKSAIETELNKPTVTSVTVTGNKTSVTETLELNIPAGKKVLWGATISTSIHLFALIKLSGGGVFESTGYITAATGTAIEGVSADVSVVISGGTVRNYCTDTSVKYSVISMPTAPTDASAVNVTVRGSGSIYSGTGSAIFSKGSVVISGSASLSVGGGDAIYMRGTSGGRSTLTIEGGSVTSTSDPGKAIDAEYCDITISGTATVSSARQNFNYGWATITGTTCTLTIEGGTIQNTTATGQAIGSMIVRVEIPTGKSAVVKGSGRAMSAPPTLVSTTVTASLIYGGSSPEPSYVPANIATYKYLKFEPSLYEAKIVGGQEYPYLYQAINAVSEGGTVQLLKNVERTSVFYLDSKTFTLDLNNCVLKGTSSTGTIEKNGGGTLTVTDTSAAKGGKITNESTSGVTIRLGIGGSSLEVTGGTVEKTNSGYAVYQSSGSTARISGGTVTNTGTGSAVGSEGVLEVSGSSVVTARNAPAIRGSFSGSITVGGAAEIISANTSTDYNGGTIRLDHSIPLNITGGTIQNTAANGIGISANASYQISVTSGSPVIQGNGKAMTHAPGLSDYNRVKVTASANYDGSDPAAEYIPANIANYKYLRFETSTGTTVTDLALTDKLTAPVTGGKPVTSITGDQYTGTVTWNGTPTKFLSYTDYTATVTLMAKAGYTFSGVAQNTLTHSGATANGVTHAAGTGGVLTVIVVFPKTAQKTLASIVITSPPDKVDYQYGERFDTRGMAVKAIYNDGTEAPLNFSYDKFEALTMSDTVVKVYYPFNAYPGIFAEQPITVTKADQTIAIAEVNDKKYGDAPFTLAITGGKSTGDVTFTVPDGNGVLTVSGSTATIVGAGTVTVTATKAGDDNYNASNTATREITIGKAAQTISIGAVTDKKYGDAAFTLTTSGGAGTGAITFTVPDDNGVLTLSGNTATIVGAGTVTVTATKAESANHNGVTATKTITVSKAAAPAITYPEAAGITYGQALSESALTGGSTEYGSFAWTNGSTIPTVSNSGYEVTFTPSAATVANYEAITPTTSIVAIAVAKAAAPVITFPTAAGVTYGQWLSDSALTGGSTEFGTFAWTNGNIIPTVSNSGYEVTFTPSAHTVANYDAITGRTHMADICVVPADATVTVNAVVSGNAGSRVATLTATVTGAQGGEPPTGSVKFVDSTGTSDADITGATAVTIANGQAIYTWTGLADQAYKVKAVYSGSDNYNAATSEEHSFDTRKQSQAALIIGDIGTKTYGDGTFILSTTGGSGSGAVTYESSDSNIVSISGATVTIHKAGTVTITATKAEDDNFNEKSATVSLTVNKKTLTVKADDKLNIKKGSALPALTHTVTGLVGNDTFSAPIISTGADINTVGEYVISISGGTLSDVDSYAVTYENGRLTVVNAVYTVTVINGTGSGSYSEGETVTVTANIRSNYTFIGWNSDDVLFADNTAATTAFMMPGKAVTVTANYRQNSSGGSDDDSSAIITPPTDRPNPPTQGEVRMTGMVDGNGNATVNITAQNVTDAYNQALTYIQQNGTETSGIILVLRVDTGTRSISGISVNLPRTVQETIISRRIANVVVVVNNPDIRIGMDLATIREINRQANTDVNITATRTDSNRLTGNARTAIGTRPVFELRVNYGSGRQVQSFGTGSVTVSIPYVLGANEQPSNVQAVYADTNGAVHWITNSVYDGVEQVLRFSTPHFSTYGVGYKQTNTTFTDTASHWAKDDIAFVVSRGLLSGTSATTFSPNTALTRGMFVTALGRLASADVSAYRKSNFIDVNNDAYYMGYIEWANTNNILKGVGGGKYAPDQSISREQVAIILQNYAKVTGLTMPKVYAATTFADSAKISASAKDAVRQMLMAGIISAKNGNIFDPQTAVSRAEVSAVLHRYVQLMISGETMQGWRMNDSGQWMYYENGKPVTGKKNIAGTSYIFDQHGVMAYIPKKWSYTTNNE